MSFSDTPYTFLELRVDMFPPEDVRDQLPGREGPVFWWHCQSCGGEGSGSERPKGRYHSAHSIGQVWFDYKAHLRNSHRLPEPQPKCPYTITIDGFDYYCPHEVHSPRTPHKLELK